MDDGSPSAAGGTYCPSCGQHQTDAGAFCSACGNALHPVDGDSGRRWLPWLIASIALVVAAIGITIGVLALVEEDTPVAQPAPSTTSTDSTQPSTSTTATTSTTTSIPEMSDAQIASEFGDAVFRIETTGCGYEGVGSGFAIDSNHIVTNQHVVNIDPTPSINTRDGSRFTGRVIGWEANPDVAVIEVDRDLTKWFDWTNAETLTEGQHLVSLGYPLPDHDFSATPGAIVSFITEGTHRAGIRSDAPLDRGNSGGPSLISDGRVAGIVTEMDLNLDGFQFVPIIVTTDEVAETIEWILAHPSRPVVNCDEIEPGNPPYAPEFPPAPDRPPYDHPEPPFYTVILGSMSVASTTYEDAWDRAYELERQYGFDTSVLLSNDFSSLKPGYWVIYAGVFYDREPAIEIADELRMYGIDAYAKQVTW